MIGSLISMAGYWLVVLILVIWMVVKTARSSPLLAVMTFLFWPVALVALVQNWGEDESDIRVPFFLALLASGLAFYMGLRAVDRAVDVGSAFMSDEDIAQVRIDNPDLANRIELAREKAWAQAEAEGAFDDEAGYYADDGYAGDSAGSAPVRHRLPPPSTTTSRRAEPEKARDPEAVEAERLAKLKQAAMGLSYRFGSIDLAGTGARLELPSHWRFIPRTSLTFVARMHGAALKPTTLGWMVHEKVDLGRDDGWFVEVHFAGGALALPRGSRIDERIPKVVLSALQTDQTQTDGPWAPASVTRERMLSLRDWSQMVWLAS